MANRDGRMLIDELSEFASRHTFKIASFYQNFRLVLVGLKPKFVMDG